MKTVLEREGKTEELKKDRKMELEDKVAKHNLQPISLGFFGGVMNFNKMNIITRKTVGSLGRDLRRMVSRRRRLACMSYVTGKKSAGGLKNWRVKPGSRNSFFLAFFEAGYPLWFSS
jgi:hypothetical protein